MSEFNRALGQLVNHDIIHKLTHLMSLYFSKKKDKDRKYYGLSPAICDFDKEWLPSTVKHKTFPPFAVICLLVLILKQIWKLTQDRTGRTVSAIC